MKKKRLFVPIALGASFLSGTTLYLNSLSTTAQSSQPPEHTNGRPVDSTSRPFTNPCNRGLPSLSLSKSPSWNGKSLREIALSYASGSGGDSAPSSIKFVGTTRQRAVCLDGNPDKVDSDQEVYLVVIKGKFALQGAFTPNPKIVPTGNTLAIVVKASDGTIMDTMLNNQPGAIEKLGEAVDITK